MAEKIRRVEENDLDDVLRLCGQLKPDGPPEKRDTALWEEILADPNQQILVVEQEGQIVATCALVLIKNLTRGGRPAAYLENVVVDNSKRGMGIGKRMLKKAIAIAREHNCYKIFLLTGTIHNEFLAQNIEERHKFYRALGFRDDIKTGFVFYLADDI